MPFKLAYPQHIVLRERCVYYCHDVMHGVALTRSQFDNLNDILHAPLNLMSYPLGGGACLMHYQNEIRLQTQTGFFTFYRKSWHRYKRWVHKRIHFILRHGGRARGEPDAYHEMSQRYQSGKATSAARWYPSHRTPRNASISHQRWKKHANFPQRHRSNSRRRNRRNGQHYVSRIRETDSATTASDDNFQSSDECSIKEEVMPVVDSSQ